MLKILELGFFVGFLENEAEFLPPLYKKQISTPKFCEKLHKYNF